MTQRELEEELEQLGSEWPWPSVAERVMARVATQAGQPTPAAARHSALPARGVPKRVRAARLFAVAAALVAALLAPWLLLGSPRTLQAQVRQDLEKTSAAHITISALDERGVRQKAEVWYSREHGFRLESAEGTIVDDGRQQWSWRPDARADESIVGRRASRDAASMIAAMFQLGDAPADWTRQRAAEHDRAIGGQPCQGYLVAPPVPQVLAGDGRRLVPDPHPPRFVVLTDPGGRIVFLEEQRPLQGQWQSRREIGIEYDVPLAAGRFSPDFPAEARVIDADRALEERFPLERALATAESGGLLFAVHEAIRAEDGMFYIVSSVRGTPQYLHDHPPQQRRLNLQTTILDVCEQSASPSVDSMTHRATLASGEAEGVHYLWWLAVPRRFYSLENGVRTPQGESVSLETAPGRPRLPLLARHRDPREGSAWLNVALEVALPADSPARPLQELAGKARGDVALITRIAGPIVALHGGVKDDQLRFVTADKLTDAEYAEEVRVQLDWLRSHDEVRPSDVEFPK